MHISEFQGLIRKIYHDKDARRGADRTFMWFVEEVGELSDALLKGNAERVRAEFSDVLAWLVSVADLNGVDLEEAVSHYQKGCPRCNQIPCRC